MSPRLVQKVSILLLFTFYFLSSHLEGALYAVPSRDSKQRAATFTPTQGERTVHGRIDAGKALRLLYGNYDLRRKFSRWTISQAEADRFEFSQDDFGEDKRELIVKPIFSRLFTEGSVERYILITQAAPPRYDCHACAPIIGGALFSRSGNNWRPDVETREITRAGSYGAAGFGGTLVPLGPDKYGVLSRPGWTGQGYTYESIMLLGQQGNQLKELLNIAEASGDNRGTCGGKQEPENQPCWSYQARVDFVPGKNSEYHDLRVRTVGTRTDDAGKVLRVNETKTYSFDGLTYRASK